jgi:hypothetical protein
MTARDDPFALARAGEDEDGDSAILLLFGEWIEAVRMAGRILDTVQDPNAAHVAWEAAMDIADAIRKRIYETPAAGAVGMAVKAYQQIYWEHGGCASLVPESPLCWYGAAMLRDAARFVPLIAELAAPAMPSDPEPQP